MSSDIAPWLRAQSQQLLAQRGHAWLLHGPAGLGQYALGLALVRGWLCENPLQGQACGQCPSCHAVDVRTHADLCVLMPEALALELGWPLDEKTQRELDEKKRKPSREIRVDAVRDAVEFCQRTSARGRGKAVLVYPAERMNAESANALLKTLEEPPGDVRFALACEAVHQLLPTVRSRCMSHAMAWPSAAESLAWLQGQGVPAGDAEVWLKASGGRPDDALALARAGVKAEFWGQLPRLVQRGNGKAAEGLTPAHWIGVLQKICHDAMALQQGAAPRFFAAADLPAVQTLAPLVAWSRQLTLAARSAEHPFNAALMTESLLLQGAAALQRAAGGGRTTRSVA